MPVGTTKFGNVVTTFVSNSSFWQIYRQFLDFFPTSFCNQVSFVAHLACQLIRAKVQLIYVFFVDVIGSFLSEVFTHLSNFYQFWILFPLVEWECSWLYRSQVAEAFRSPHWDFQVVEK